MKSIILTALAVFMVVGGASVLEELWNRSPVALAIIASTLMICATILGTAFLIR